MSKPDWSKAPKGATHWGPDSKRWGAWFYRLDKNGVWWGFSGCGDIETKVDACEIWPKRLSKLIPRPAKPRWIAHNGNGMPVASTTMVDVAFIDGSMSTEPVAAMKFYWGKGIISTIIAYRISDTQP